MSSRDGFQGGSFVCGENDRRQSIAMATTGFLSLEEYNMLQKITMATTGFLSFTIPYLESSKGCGTRGHLTWDSLRFLRK